jgi:hypothetical protein
VAPALLAIADMRGDLADPLAWLATICGSRPIDSRTGGSRAAVCSSYAGTGKTTMTGTLPAAGLCVNPANGSRLREPEDPGR